MSAKRKSKFWNESTESNEIQLTLFEQNFEKALNETEIAEVQFDQRPAANTEEYRVWLRQIIHRAIKNLD